MDKFSLILIYLFLNWLYLPLSRRQAKYYWQLPIDKKIPLFPVAVLPYVSYYFFFLAGSLILIFSSLWREFLLVMIMVQLAADWFWYCFPNGVRRPAVSGNTWPERLVKQLYRFNPEDAPGLPSVHTFHSLIIGMYLSQLYPAAAGFIWLWAGLIIASTVLVKQHYLLDMLAGIFLVFVLKSFL